MEDRAWVSIASLNPDRGLWMKSEPISGDQPFPYSIQERNNQGEALGADCFPDVQWMAGDREAKTIPDLFQGASGFILSERAVEVLKGFNLGNARFFPVRLQRRDRVTEYPGRFHFLNIGNLKAAFLPDQSPRVRKSSDGKWVPPGSLADDDFAVGKAAATQGPDIWVDPRLNNCFFVSGLLGAALEKAKLAKPFWLRRCRMIDA